MKRLLALAALLAALVWITRPHPHSILTLHITLPDPADAIQVDPSLHERAGL